MKIVTLSREEYLTSVKKMDDFYSLKFSKHALECWDDYYSWKLNPPLCLIDDNHKHVCYLFYSVSSDKSYLTIKYLLTPKPDRHHGFAYILLNHLFHLLSEQHIQRFRMYCLSSSLEFYTKLGLEYWGVNDIGQYYCDFKMPLLDISEIPQIVEDSSVNDFTKIRFDEIYEKLKNNGDNFNIKDTETYQKSLIKMGDKYIFYKLLNRVKVTK